MRRIIILCLSLLLILGFCSCGTKRDRYISKDIFAMDTVISLNIPSEIKESESVFKAAEQYIIDIENNFSATIDTSEVSRFNISSDGLYSADSEMYSLVTLSLDVYDSSNGAFDPSAGVLSLLWDMRGEGRIPESSEIYGAMRHIGADKITASNGNILKSDPLLCLDLGGIAKGYALGKTCEYLKSLGAEYGIVSFGGNVGLIGNKPDGEEWQVAIKDPYDTSSVIGTLSIPGGYVSVSGDYERYFECDGVKYHHIFDPSTGYPVRNGIHTVAVYTNDAALGDALSTALFVMGYEEAIELYDSGKYSFEALFVTDEGIKMTSGMENLFMENTNEN